MPNSAQVVSIESSDLQKKTGDLFTDRLYRELFKPDGFKKKGKTFSRLHATYGEHYNIQGSAWNSPHEPWRFYVNCGVSFPDIPVHTKGAGMRAFHAHTRLRFLVPESLSEYAITHENFEATLAKVVAHLKKCSSYFAQRHEVLRRSYLDKKYRRGFPHDPDLRSD